MEQKFRHDGISENTQPFTHIYLTLKAHEHKVGQHINDLKSCLMISYPGSLIHGLGVWEDHKLQEVAQKISHTSKICWNKKINSCS